MKQRAVIKFHAKLGTTATESFKMMRKVYGGLSRLKTLEWHKRRQTYSKVLTVGVFLAWFCCRMIKEILTAILIACTGQFR